MLYEVITFRPDRQRFPTRILQSLPWPPPVSLQPEFDKPARLKDNPGDYAKIGEYGYGMSEINLLV